MRRFLLKFKHFFRRNIYPITVSVCTVLILAIVTISAYNSIKNSSSENSFVETVKEEVQQPSIITDVEEEPQIVTPINSSDTIIFGLPFENATISKQYADSSLLYDATTKLWCTHQGLDFACEDGKKIFAVYDGTIEKIENSMMFGTVTYLKISDELTVVYKGLSANLSVKEGDKITKGTMIGVISSFLAEKADGVHLHLELMKNEKLIDPTEYFSFNK